MIPRKEVFLIMRHGKKNNWKMSPDNDQRKIIELRFQFQAYPARRKIYGLGFMILNDINDGIMMKNANKKNEARKETKEKKESSNQEN